MSNKIPIELVSMDIVFSYNYKNADITNNQCTICKQHIMAPTINLKNKNTLSCSVTMGKCKHLFHTDCINNHIKTGNIVCPIDMTPWNQDHELDTKNVFKKLDQNKANIIKTPSVTYASNNKMSK